eukprot:TRINITY_DN21469_c0_g1_i1.p1 TRINITY_DN21469_c0_g1~~TRINITY_DN21469_c0_g1_i1.p1  ORF type:complete len:133 (-),score=20.78 TRINITY_DN21469_c0_g1_i1:242-640(-)
MQNYNPVGTPLTSHFRLSSKDFPASKEDKEKKASISYTYVVGCNMYDMVCTHPNIAYRMEAVSLYTDNSALEQWEAVKGIVQYPKELQHEPLCLAGGKLHVLGFVDVNFVSYRETQRSTIDDILTPVGGAMS